MKLSSTLQLHLENVQEWQLTIYLKTTVAVTDGSHCKKFLSYIMMKFLPV